MDSLLNAFKKIGRVDCTIHLLTSFVLGLVGAVIFFFALRAVRKKTDMSKSAKGSVTNVYSTGTTYSVSIEYKFEDSTVTKKVSTPNMYVVGQNVDIVYNPANGEIALSDEYMPVPVAANLLLTSSGICVMCCCISFLVVSTDWGCAIVAIRNAARML
ncbi:MAG: hypothetical protein ACOYNN_14000 [Terrimicrobiaceae bacterium]|jgi:hypothetical protein